MRTLLLVIIGVSISYFYISRRKEPKSSISKEVTSPKPRVLDPKLEEFIANFESKLENSFNEYDIPGAAVAIVIDTTLTLVKALGKKSSKEADSVDLNTSFRLASVSKGFASILTGIVLEQNNASWTDPISKYLNEFSVNPNEQIDSITIEHILSHTSGYPYQTYSTLIEDGLDRDRLFEELKTIRLARKPGEIHSYQNVAYSLIEPVIEKLTSATYQKLLKTLVFDQLSMNNASVTYDEMINSGNHAQPHGLRKKQYVPVKLSPAYYNVAAAGGINASASDMAQWLKALLGQHPDIISKSVLDEVFRPRIRTSVKNYHFSNFDRPRKGHYALGWRVVEYPNDTLIYHGGYANGFKSELALDRNQNIAISILTNAPSRFCNEMVVEFFKDYKQFIITNQSAD